MTKKSEYQQLSEAIRAYGWEGGKEAQIALALDELLKRPTLPLADLISLARQSEHVAKA